MESVMGSEELVGEILAKLTLHRHLARCSAVSKLWHRRIAMARAALPRPDTLLVSLGTENMLWSINPVTAEQRQHTYPGRSPFIIIQKVLATCRGLVLLSTGMCFGCDQLIIGDPITDKWYALPLPDFSVAAALLVRDEPGLEEHGGILILIMSQLGRFDRFDFEGGGVWVKLNAPPSHWPYLYRPKLIRNLVYHQHGVLASFYRSNDEDRVFWFSLRRRRWSEVLSSSSRREFLAFAMHWRGRLLLVKTDAVFELVVEVEERSGLCTGGKLVKGSLEDMVGSVTAWTMLPCVVVGDAYGLYWSCPEPSWICPFDIVGVSLADKKVVRVSLPLSLPRPGLDFLCFTPDEGEAIHRFRSVRVSNPEEEEEEVF